MPETSIEWTDHTINPIRARAVGGAADARSGHYCEKVSPGCTHCYASGLQHRFGNPPFGSGQHRERVELFLEDGKLREVLHRRRPTRFFWCDMTDLFGDWVPDEWIDACFATMALTPQHTHQVLTKRPERMRRYFCESVNGSGDPRAAAIEYAGYALGIDRPLGWLDDDKPLPNVWLGVSVEDQRRADERIPLLLQTPAAVRFLSCEPLLGPLDLFRLRCNIAEFACGHAGRVAFAGDYYAERFPNPNPENHDDPGWATCCGECGCEKIRPLVHWVIAGGESGPAARPCNLAWLRSIVAQCRAAGVACFVKQLGACASDSVNGIAGAALRVPEEAAPLVSLRLRDRKGGDMEQWPSDLRVREFPAAAVAR